VKVLLATALTAVFLYFGYSQIPQEIKLETFNNTTRNIYNNYEIIPIIKEDYKKLKKEKKIREIEETWTVIFDEAGASPDDDRRMYFRLYAETIVEILEEFQNKDSKTVKITGVELPKNELIHILIAYIVYRESSVNPTVVGKKPRREVGLMQAWGRALMGFSREEVRKDFELGLFLGIHWLGTMIQECKIDVDSMQTINSWKGPLSLYGAGPKRAIKNGRCLTNFRFANRRIKKTKELARLVKKEIL
jgi:hypothetical protein